MSISNCCFLTCIQVSQEVGQVVWYSYHFKYFPQFIVIRTVKGFGIVNKAEIDVFLELSCFFNDPADVGNLTSGCSAFSKTSLNVYAEYIMWNARMDEAQAGIKILGEISITSDMKMTLPLWQEAKNNLRDSWWNWKRRVKTLAKNPTFRKLISCHWVPSLHGKRWGNNGKSGRLYFGGIQNHWRWWLQPWN